MKFGICSMQHSNYAQNFPPNKISLVVFNYLISLLNKKKTSWNMKVLEIFDRKIPD